MRDFACGLLLAVAVVTSAAPGPARASKLRILFTAELRGNLLPCPCPERPLGGIARRTAWIDSVRGASRDPLLVLDAGGAVPRRFRDEDGEPLDLVRSTFCEGLRRSRYDALAGDPLAFTGAPNLPWLRAGNSRLVERDGIRVEVISASEHQPLPPPREGLPVNGAIPRLLLCDGDLSFARAAAASFGADIAIVSRGARFDPPRWFDGVLFLGPGVDGKYIGDVVLEVGEGEPRIRSHRLRSMDGTVVADPAMQARLAETVAVAASSRPDLLGVGE